jgi:hypothetical protein
MRVERIHIRQCAESYNKMGEPKLRAGLRDNPAGPIASWQSITFEIPP